MNRFIGISLILFILLFLGNNSGLSQDFPTDDGSVVLSGSFSKKKSEYKPFAYYEKRVSLSGSLAYMLFMDVSLGIWTEYEKISSGKSYRTDFALGPQLTWYIEGHTHRPQLGGNFYQYIGFALLNRKWEENSFNCDSTGCGYKKSAYSSPVYRFSFGLMVMINNYIGVNGEAAVHLFNRHHSYGKDLIIAGPGGETTLDLGLILFLY